MSKRTPKTYPIYGEAKVSSAASITKGLKDLENQKKYDSLMKMYEQKSKDYNEIVELYEALVRSGVSNEMYQESLLKCEELIAANKSCAEKLTAEKHNVELLKQQIQNNSAYIGRLNEVIALLNLQIFKK